MTYAVIETDANGIPAGCTLKGSQEDAIELAVKIIQEKGCSMNNYRQHLEDTGWYGEGDWVVSVVLTD